MPYDNPFINTTKRIAYINGYSDGERGEEPDEFLCLKTQKAYDRGYCDGLQDRKVKYGKANLLQQMRQAGDCRVAT